MFYCTTVEVPAQTPQSAPVEEYLPLGPGTITGWCVGFPAGCSGLVHVLIRRFEHQVLPEGEGQDLYWDDYMFSIGDKRDLDEEPYQVKIVAWNDDDSYLHKIFVGVEVMPVGEETTESLLSRLLHALVGA